MIHLFNKYLWNVYHMPATVLAARDRAENRTVCGEEASCSYSKVGKSHSSDCTVFKCDIKSASGCGSFRETIRRTGEIRGSRRVYAEPTHVSPAVPERTFRWVSLVRICPSHLLRSASTENLFFYRPCRLAPARVLFPSRRCPSVSWLLEAGRFPAGRRRPFSRKKARSETERRGIGQLRLP